MWLLQQKKQSYNSLENLFDFPYITENKYLNNHSVELKETADEFSLSVVLPGVLKKDVKLEYRDGYVMVAANKKSELESISEGDSKVSDLTTVDYQRQFYVGDIDSKKISAKLNHGILTIILPKKEEQKAQLIQIS